MLTEDDKVVVTEAVILFEDETVILGDILLEAVILLEAETVLLILGVFVVVTDAEGVTDAIIKSTSASTPLSFIDSSLLNFIVITRPVEYTILCFGIPNPDIR